MIVNLYVDHMMSAPATSSDDVWAATRDHSTLFATAANRIGLTPAEYREFRSNLLDGNALYVRLPRRMDAMSANHNGRVYVVKNAVMTTPEMGWKVALADGNVVYVPRLCGNISLLRPVAIAHVAPKHKRVIAAAKPKFVPALGVVAAAPPVAPVVETPVIVAPPVVAAPVVAAAPLAVPAAVTAAHGIPGFLYALPIVFGAIIAGTTHHDTPVVPPCSHGSNLMDACQQ
jgi:hypothetical protein